MKKFALLHIGFKKPTPEVMQAWGAWFASIKDQTVDAGGLMNGREISKDGTKELGFDLEAITGFNIVEAESIEEAEKMAQSCPFITSIRVYEIRTK
jgi:YCII-related domain